jgi:peroxiredoxin
MKYTLSLFLFLGFSSLSYSQSTTANAFYTETLKGLRLETNQDSLPKSMKLDGSIPAYDESGKELKGMEMIQALQSGNFFPVRYINESKEVKAYVFRSTTEEEKSKLKKAMQPTSMENNVNVKPAKDFSIKDMAGIEHSLKNLKDKVVVMNFWFVECMPCRKEIPELNELVKTYENKGVVFLGIADSDKKKVEKFIQKTEFKYNLIPKETTNNIIQDYNINSYPTHTIIDKKGNVKFNEAGLSGNTIESLKKIIDSLIK